MLSALVTGGTGFIGSNLCRTLLKKGWKVYLITRKNSNYDNILDIKDKMKIFEYENFSNLLNFIKNIKINVVFHLASANIMEYKTENIHNILQSNITFGTEILEALKFSTCKLFINTGTAYQNYNNEDYNPVNLYAATKQAFQDIIKYYSEVENIRCITLKLFDTYGENDKRPKLLNLLYQFENSQKKLNLSLGNQLLNLIHIDDVINGYIVAYNNLIENENLKYEKYVLATENTYQLKNVVKLFEKVNKIKLNINWGGKNYRKREIMISWTNYKILPNWKSKITLEEGLKRIYLKNINSK